MIPIKFKQANTNLVKPYNVTDIEDMSLWVFSDGIQCVSCWKLTFVERLKILLYGHVWLSVLSGKTQPPVWLDCEKTIFNEEVFSDGNY